MRKRFFTVMAAALVVSGMPVMAKETSMEEKISEAVEETKDSTEAESVVSGNEDRISEIEKQIHDLEKQIAALKEERKQLRESNVAEIGDVIYQDESVIITYNGIKEDEYCPMEDLEYLEFKVAVLDGDSYDEICISDPVTISFE